MSKIRKIVTIGMSAALLVAVQVGFMFLPNIEFVSLLFIIFGLTYSLGTNIQIVVVFSTLQWVIHGFGDWVIGYYWIWTLWVVIIYIIKRYTNPNNYAWAVIGGIWGLIFGALFALNHGIFYGLSYSFAYWIKGIGFDLIHFIGNYVVIFILYNPLIRVMEIMEEKDRA